MLERVAWARSPEERLKIRQEKEVPIIDELIAKIKGKLTDGRILPKSKLREAIGYFCGLIPYLKNYTKSPSARLDNNVAERAIRPLAIGRKNWLFFGSVEGGEAGAVILSLVQTCRGLGINPRNTWRMSCEGSWATMPRSCTSCCQINGRRPAKKLRPLPRRLAAHPRPQLMAGTRAEGQSGVRPLH